MTWFGKLTGFEERGYEDTQSKLEVEGETLRSRVNGRAFRAERLELVSLKTLRERAAGLGGGGRLKVRNVSGDVRQMHGNTENAGALFQVASQFNLLEMVGPSVTPEQGVGIYENDPTQGPACAIAAGAATIYRNYFAPVDGTPGQTADRQLDGLGDIGGSLSAAMGVPVEQLWTMRNGYALCTPTGLAGIQGHLRNASPAEVDDLRSRLKIGLHWDVEATDDGAPSGQLVSQAFCSALPVAYARMPGSQWQAFAELVLEAAYEATMLAAGLNAARGASGRVLLTRLGGSAFGNDDAWIDRAMTRALNAVRTQDLDVVLVSYGQPPRSMLALESQFS